MIVCSGGGTGGHLVIIDAVANYLDDIVYIGSQKGQDRDWFANDTRFTQRIFLQTAGVVDKKGFAKAGALLQILAQMKSVWPVVRKSSAVFSVGGFSAAPAAILAVLLRKPLIIHEQNSVPGRLNVMLKPFAKEVIESFGKDRSDYPVKEVFFKQARQRKRLKTILFLGGSQGASGINAIALQVAKRYDFAIIHQCGKSEYAMLQKEYAKLGVEVDLFTFSKDIAGKMHKADIAVARAGASTVWETCANGLPAVFVPFPYAARDHQYYNALATVENGAGWVMRQESFDMNFFQSLDDATLQEASRRLLGMLRPGGAEKIAKRLRKFGK